MRDIWRDNKDAAEAVDTKMGTLLNSQDADNNLTVKQTKSILALNPATNEPVEVTAVQDDEGNWVLRTVKAAEVAYKEDEDVGYYVVKNTGEKEKTTIWAEETLTDSSGENKVRSVPENMTGVLIIYYISELSHENPSVRIRTYIQDSEFGGPASSGVLTTSGISETGFVHHMFSAGASLNEASNSEIDFKIASIPLMNDSMRLRVDGTYDSLTIKAIAYWIR